ncbi:hypothetical protein IQ264_19320 [Phormidium sp. LEGE 05292]|uniref:hypothetical protein n=1 Tax=[Phormidium] sp. LEGE 05292 TaxID=767427 RepID=UPI0018827681|nr:hypothetical protein [Phormidium sp. LEGE 05292]MBE9227583.1 hypothetical protein [Phormidium sp. LEGE 05292]
MGHLNITVTTLLLAFFTITCQTLNFQSQAITTEKSETSVNEQSIISMPLAFARRDNRGSGR